MTYLNKRLEARKTRLKGDQPPHHPVVFLSRDTYKFEQTVRLCNSRLVDLVRSAIIHVVREFDITKDAQAVHPPIT